MTLQMSTTQADLIQRAEYMWFTTVREDGMPQPTPVWFVQDGDSYIVYTTKAAQKLKNITSSSKVALSFTPDLDGEDFVVIMGHATVDPTVPKPSMNVGYQAKYGQSIPGIGMTADQFDNTFNIAIRILPTAVRSGE